jgi:hypothetical protein
VSPIRPLSHLSLGPEFSREGSGRAEAPQDTDSLVSNLMRSRQRLLFDQEEMLPLHVQDEGAPGEVPCAVSRGVERAVAFPQPRPGHHCLRTLAQIVGDLPEAVLS